MRLIKIITILITCVSCGPKGNQEEHSDAKAMINPSGSKIVGITLKSEGKKPQVCFATLHKDKRLELITDRSLEPYAVRRALRKSSYAVATGKALVVTGVTAAAGFTGLLAGMHAGYAGGFVAGGTELAGDVMVIGALIGGRVGLVAGGAAGGAWQGETVAHAGVGLATGVVGLMGILAGAGPIIAVGAAAAVSITGFTITERVIRGSEYKKLMSDKDHYVSEDRYNEIVQRMHVESYESNHSEFFCEDTLDSFKEIYIKSEKL